MSILPKMQWMTDTAGCACAHGFGLHAILQNHAVKGTRGTKPIVRGTLMLVEVGQLPHQTGKPMQFWL